MATEFGSSSPIPADVENDRLLWLRIAADRGEPIAQIRFALAAFEVDDAIRRANAVMPMEALAPIYDEAIANLEKAAKSGVADALNLLSIAYSRPALGRAYDAPRAHALLIELERSNPTPETQQLRELSARRLRASELVRSVEIASNRAFFRP